MTEALRNAGPFAFINIAAGAFGLLLAIATIGLTAAKSNAARVFAVLCLLGVLAILALGFAGYSFGMVGTRAALGNVPDDMKDLILRKGTQESRGNFIVALAAALLPLLGGTLAAARTRFVPSLVLTGIALVAFAATAIQVTAPLPPEGPLLAEPPGIQLPQSSSPRSLRIAALVALTPEGLWADGARVTSLAAALENPLVQQRNTSTLPVLVDARTTFAALADLVEAADKAGRGSLQLVVLAPTGGHQVIEIVGAGAGSPGKSPLNLTVRLREKEFLIGASGGTLDPIPPNPMGLNDKLAEVKAAFPSERSLRMTADPEVPVGLVVKALDAAGQRDGKLLFDQLVVGRFTVEASPAGD